MEVTAEMEKQEEQQLSLVDLAAANDWQIGEVNSFGMASGENLSESGRVIGRYYKRGEGSGLVTIGQKAYYFHAVNHYSLTGCSGEDNLKPAIGEKVNVFANLSSGDEIVILETGPGRKGRPEATKWCFVKQLAEVEFCSLMPTWRITSSDWCNGQEKPERAKELWQGNNLKALVQFVTQYRSKLLDWSEVCGSNNWEHQFHLECQKSDGGWEEPELDSLPDMLHYVYGEHGFGHKNGRPVVFAV